MRSRLRWRSLALSLEAHFRGNVVDGAWRIDLSKSVMPTKADVFLLENGIYQCQRCVPVNNIKADGQDQSVTVQRLRAAPLRQQLCRQNARATPA
jgi:hypothetical protein